MTHTREQLEQMPDAELSAVVATEVMQWRLEYHDGVPQKKMWTRQDGQPVHLESHWSPPTCWSAMGRYEKA